MECKEAKCIDLDEYENCDRHIQPRNMNVSPTHANNRELGTIDDSRSDIENERNVMYFEELTLNRTILHLKGETKTMPDRPDVLNTYHRNTNEFERECQRKLRSNDSLQIQVKTETERIIKSNYLQIPRAHSLNTFHNMSVLYTRDSLFIGRIISLTPERCRRLLSKMSSVLLFSVFFSMCLSGASADICHDPTAILLQNSIFKAATPAGGSKAGNFHKDLGAHDLKSCIFSCCQRPSCDVVFLKDQMCFMIDCDSPELCRPKAQAADKFKNSFTVVVRSLNNFKLRECLSDDDCDSLEQCTLKDGSQTTLVCMCQDVYERSGITGACEVPTPTDHSITNPPIHPTSCELGLHTCPHNQFCYVEDGSKSRSGQCICLPGYHFVEDGQCRGFTTDEPTSATNETTTNSPQTSTSTNTTPKTTESHPPTTTPKVKVTKPPPTSAVTTTTTTPEPVVKLMIKIGGNTTIQLPKDSISLNAFALPSPKADETYKYEWTAVNTPEGSQNVYMENQNTDTVKLSKLIAGTYQFKIKVTGDSVYGEATANVTVLGAKRINKPPVAVVKPTNQNVTLPDNILIKADESKDDDKIVKYQWAMVSGPLQSDPIPAEKNDAFLILKNVAAGKYVFKLTVTDSDGATNSTIANVMVLPEVDNPPKAVVGSDVIITLPQNSVDLLGNGSYDDLGIVSYKWSPKSGSHYSGDMTGAQSSRLHLSKLQEGSYTFTLQVTDKAGQTDNDDVTVIVKPPRNQAPIAKAGKDAILLLPFSHIVLDASNSTDDSGITSYHWQQTGDLVTKLTIDKPDAKVTKATGDITPGLYTFTLTVTDNEKLESTSKVTYTVKQTENTPPVANPGPKREIQLPVSIVTIDGSQSHDDRGIVSFHWMREDQSVAAGDVLNGSDHTARLTLANLVSGQYVFTLTVTDASGLHDSKTTTLTVKPDVQNKNILEIILDTSLTSFTQENKNNLIKQLTLLLNNAWPGETTVHVLKLSSESESRRVLVHFLVQTDLEGKVKVQNGVEVLNLLKKKLGSQSDVLDYRIVTLDTVVCQSNCSGHGRCHPLTKLCVCEAFWMGNIFKANFGLRRSNCEWSILYVVIIVFVVVIVTSAASWLVVYSCRRKSLCRCRPRTRRLRYSLLRNHDDDADDELELKTRRNHPNSKSQISSLMVSDSELSSEDETLFISQKTTPNGNLHKTSNGTKTYPRNKIKA